MWKKVFRVYGISRGFLLRWNRVGQSTLLFVHPFWTNHHLFPFDKHGHGRVLILRVRYVSSCATDLSPFILGQICQDLQECFALRPHLSPEYPGETSDRISAEDRPVGPGAVGSSRWTASS